MRNVPEGFSGAAMTLARCWRVTRSDGMVMGFTDHDRDLAFDGVVFQAGTGLEAADMEATLGFNVTGGDVAGALVSPSLTEAEIAGGRYDGARVDVWLVDWTAPEQRLLIDSGVVGEIRREGQRFVAEIRTLSHRLDERRGRSFRKSCSADLGDARCTVSLLTAAYRFSGTVTATDGRSYLVAVMSGFLDGLFTGGKVTFSSGANKDLAIEVRTHAQTGTTGALTLWRPPGAMIAAGDAFVVTAGCDKQMATCRNVFNNLKNFRGFPHMPGNDFVVRAVSDGEANMDGGSFFR
jgi:uncharacterized phage protein (TIGR02218 family)